MSQIQTFIGSEGPIGTGPVLTIQGDIGLPVPPAIGGNVNIHAIGGKYGFGALTSTPNPENPVIPANTLVLQPLFDDITTIDASTILFNFAKYTLLPSQAVVLTANVIGHRDDYSAACGGYACGVAVKDAINPAVWEGDNPLVNTSTTATFGVVVSGDTLNVFVQGVVGETWNWTCSYTFQVSII